jgi:DNA-binding CsgD family transcriptional regulator
MAMMESSGLAAVLGDVLGPSGVADPAPQAPLVPRGRRRECHQLDALLDAVRAGESRTTVLRGEPGIGKTVLLDYLHSEASDCRVVRAGGVQSEMELPFGALHQLCGSLLDRLERLPSPQREALSTAFGLMYGVAPDRFLVGLAVLSLLAAAADDRPLVCLVDDAQWLDRASALALGFAARRMLAEPVAVVFAARLPVEELSGLPDLLVEGLPQVDARAVLASAIGGPLDVRVLDRIVAETGGNPLALTELPRGTTAAQLAGGFALPHVMGLSGRIEDCFLQRLQALPAPTRRLLLVAAAESAGDPALVWRAAGMLGIRRAAAAPAEAAGLLAIGTRLRFRHPLVRSAIYRAASPGDRREVHRALAAATDPQIDPDHRAWQRAHATVEPDEEVADELQRSARRARGRGGLAAAAAFLEQAAELTPSSARRAERELEAAQAMLHAGGFASAQALLARAEAGPLDGVGRARVQLLLGRMAFAMDRGREAPPLLLAAAKRLEPLDVRLARETYLDAFLAAASAGRLSTGGDPVEIAEAVRCTPQPTPSTHEDLLLFGLAVLATEGYAAARSHLCRALDAFATDQLPTETALRWTLLAAHTAIVVWDHGSWQAICARQVDRIRSSGALSMLPAALSARVCAHVFAGELDAAVSLIDETNTVTEATGVAPMPYGAVVLAAAQGREDQTVRLAGAGMQEMLTRGEGLGVTFTQWAFGMLYNGLGRYDDAVSAAAEAIVDAPQQAVSGWARMELIEGAVRSGRAGLAAAAHEGFLERESGTNWALGVDARSRALLSEGSVAEAAYREAIERLDRSGATSLVARTRLVYGEWLRREHRRRDAREQLRIAHAMLTDIGMAAFAQRAACELRATGERARRRSVETRDDLTTREAEIARLARDGLTNFEIGGRLFLSPRTVEYHLHKVFGKLDITSRGELVGALRVPDQASGLVAR